jgi:hypothetical protein
MTFSITVICSNNLEMLKATESILSKLYKTTLFNVDLGIMRIQASMAVPEDFSQDRLFEFALNDKKEFNVTFDLEVKSFVPVFENGILLNEIAELTRAAMESNPNAEGVGLFRCGADGNVGIYFGGVFQKFEYTVDNLAKVAPESIISNQQYVNPNDINRGGPYIESETTSAGFNPDTKKYTDTETEASKEYRNAQDDEG